MRHTWLFATVLLTASVAAAQDAGRHSHDGLYLRLQVGGGYTRAESTFEDLAVKGAAGAVNAELGFAVLQNFIIYGKLFGASAQNPDLEFGDVTIEGQDDDVSQNFGALGAGVTYYLMPANVYLSGALSFARLTITEDGDTIAETDPGVGLHLGVGKEWWVSDNWGLGVGGELALGRIRSDDGEDDWNVLNVMLLLSATFN
ncbi:outer membrane beta-barrel protein [Pyxidicoccus xibeiensis]|uniref:outer membrane beta-barrel protein n=1 Tax=Pyxidicoccus xibeiensis TaxID=2906759 RepID=UPI0020A76DBD|nr:outer membrane beta-barrel protein [Pyxidicoccus xibeiensis]MCP3135837.1 porin family protein [Pyxidicoccus xibeiensis]